VEKTGTKLEFSREQSTYGLYAGMLLKAKELYNKTRSLSCDIRSEGNCSKPGHAARLPGELPVEGGEPPGVPSARQMQHVGRAKSKLSAWLPTPGIAH
jgi:hypothetical protein